MSRAHASYKHTGIELSVHFNGYGIGKTLPYPYGRRQGIMIFPRLFSSGKRLFWTC